MTEVRRLGFLRWEYSWSHTGWGAVVGQAKTRRGAKRKLARLMAAQPSTEEFWND